MLLPSLATTLLFKTIFSIGFNPLVPQLVPTLLSPLMPSLMYFILFPECISWSAILIQSLPAMKFIFPGTLLHITSQAGAASAPREHLVMSKDNWALSQPGWWAKGAAGIEWAQADHPTMQRTAPHSTASAGLKCKECSSWEILLEDNVTLQCMPYAYALLFLLQNHSRLYLNL